MDASTTRLFLKLVGANSVLGKYTVYVESDFRGGQDYGFRLRQAYVNARGFLVGQTWSTFVDPAAAPPTIDYEGPNGVMVTIWLFVSVCPIFRFMSSMVGTKGTIIYESLVLYEVCPIGI